MLCPNCQSGDAIIHNIYGVTPCSSCQKKQQTQTSPGGFIEFTSEEIKQGRSEYASDILQPYRSGQVSKRYIQRYGTKNLDVTEKEVKEAMDKPDVYSGDDTFYRE